MKLNVKVRNGTRNGTRQVVVLWFILDELMTMFFGYITKTLHHLMQNFGIDILRINIWQRLLHSSSSWSN